MCIIHIQSIIRYSITYNQCIQAHAQRVFSCSIYMYNTVHILVIKQLINAYMYRKKLNKTILMDTVQYE